MEDINMSKKYRFQIREFLNKKRLSRGSSVIAYVEDTSKKKFDAKKVAKQMIKNKTNKTYYSDIPSPSINFEIKGCESNIIFDFDMIETYIDYEFNSVCDSNRAVENIDNKIDLLIDTLSSFKEAMYQEFNLYKNRKKEITEELKKLKEKENENK
jgi:hypothetical protein